MRDLIPETLKVGRYRWRVEFLPQLEMNEFDANYKTINGWCDAEERVIYLSETLNGRRLMQIFLHEAIHACDFSFGINVPHPIVYKLDRRLGNLIWDNFVKPRRRRR